jgi:histidine triad (HIT) family protein
MPQATGHTLVIPKAPSRNLLDADPDDLAYVVKIAQKIAKVAMSVFSADGLNLIQFNEPAAGQTVYHLHVHIIPRQEGVPLRPHGTYKEDPGVLAEQAAKLAAALKSA